MAKKIIPAFDIFQGDLVSHEHSDTMYKPVYDIDARSDLDEDTLVAGTIAAVTNAADVLTGVVLTDAWPATGTITNDALFMFVESTKSWVCIGHNTDNIFQIYSSAQRLAFTTELGTTIPIGSILEETDTSLIYRLRADLEWEECFIDIDI